MPLYIKFDSKEEENLVTDRIESFIAIFEKFEKNFSLTDSKYFYFKEMPFSTYNPKLDKKDFKELKASLKEFQAEQEKTKTGIEIDTTLTKKVKMQFSFVLFPEKDTRKELPDIMIDVIPTNQKSQSITELVKDVEFRNTLVRTTSDYQADENNLLLKIKKLKVTDESEFFSPASVMYFRTPKEYIIDCIRFAKTTSKSLRRNLDLANETKIGTIIYNNEAAQERLNLFMKEANVLKANGSLWLIEQKENGAMDLYKKLEETILTPVAKEFPNRNAVTNAIIGQKSITKKIR